MDFLMILQALIDTLYSAMNVASPSVLLALWQVAVSRNWQLELLRLWPQGPLLLGTMEIGNGTLNGLETKKTPIKDQNRASSGVWLTNRGPI